MSESTKYRSLSKNETMDLVLDPSREFDFQVGLSWDYFDGMDKIDLDAQVVALDTNGTIKEAVFYNQLQAFNGALVHSGDNHDGVGEGFDELIQIDLEKIPPEIAHLVFVVSCYSKGDFSSVETALAELIELPRSDELGDKRIRKMMEISVGSHAGFSSVILFYISRHQQDGSKWTVTSVDIPVKDARNFQSCAPNIHQLFNQNNLSNNSSETTTTNSLSLDKTFNMKKGDSAQFPLDLNKVRVGLGWTYVRRAVDLDASIIIMNHRREIENVVYYGRQSDHKRGIRLHDDNRTGNGEGDDEVISIDLTRAGHHDGDTLNVVVNIYSAGFTFERHVKDAYVRLFSENGKELARYNLDATIKTGGLFFCVLTYQNQQWNLTTTGLPCDGPTAHSGRTTRVVKDYHKQIANNNNHSSDYPRVQDISDTTSYSPYQQQSEQSSECCCIVQ